MSTRFTIYCHTNKVNGKRYVGQTLCSMEKRWGEHVSSSKASKGGSRVLAKAIRKYGADAFDHRVLEVVSTQEAADLAESLWIEKLICRVPSGYNLKSGGGGRWRHHEETIQRIRDALAKVKPIRSKKIRASWAAMNPKSRADRVCKMRSSGTKSDDVRAIKSSAWQTAQARKRTPEQRRDIVLKSWAVRRARYGELGHTKLPGEIGDTSRKTWAGKTFEALVEHGQKIREGHRRSHEAKNSRMVRINLLRTE